MDAKQEANTTGLLLVAVRDALASFPRVQAEYASVAMGLVAGLRVAKHHPEYAVALGDRVEAKFESDRPGKESWPDDFARELPERVPLTHIEAQGAEEEGSCAG